VTVYGRKWPT